MASVDCWSRTQWPCEYSIQCSWPCTAGIMQTAIDFHLSSKLPNSNDDSYCLKYPVWQYCAFKLVDWLVAAFFRSYRNISLRHLVFVTSLERAVLSLGMLTFTAPNRHYHFNAAEPHCVMVSCTKSLQRNHGLQSRSHQKGSKDGLPFPNLPLEAKTEKKKLLSNLSCWQRVERCLARCSSTWSSSNIRIVLSSPGSMCFLFKRSPGVQVWRNNSRLVALAGEGWNDDETFFYLAQEPVIALELFSLTSELKVVLSRQTTRGIS